MSDYDQRREAMARGGRATAATSPAKAAALQRLFAQRRGQPVNQPGLPARRYRALMTGLRELLREPIRERLSRRHLAKQLNVDARTVGRWLAGQDRAPARAVPMMQAYLRHGRDAK